jgi:sigma-B regulation protein RsbU (phosphoserine phosphatase)
MIAQTQTRSAPPPCPSSDDCLGYLAALGDRAATAGEADKILSAALADLADLFGARGAGIYEAPEDGGPLISLAAVGDIGPLGREAALQTPAVISAPLVLSGQRLGLLALEPPGHPGFEAGAQARLEALAPPLALTLSHVRLTEALAQQDGVKRELALAAEIQRNLLPGMESGAFPVLGLNRPIRQVSGDFFDFFASRGGGIPFALADVSGKGINAALLMAKTAGLFRCLAKSCDDPAELLGVINREICETATRGMFVTMVAGVYDSATGRVRFANAGHEPPLLRTPERSYHSFPASAPPLGILPELAFETEEVALDGGELYLFTDGLTEYRYGREEALGVEGIVQLIESLAELPLAERVGALLAELDQEGWEARDDLTVLVIDDAWVRSHG